MIIYKLPDLGEGLPDAIIREWYVKPGDTVKADQSLAAMETAKALVDVPAPFDGKIEKLFGNPGDTIETGEPFIGFVEEGKKSTAASDDSSEKSILLKDSVNPVATAVKDYSQVKAAPAVRALAKKLGVNLADISPQGEHITAAEVEKMAGRKSHKILEEGLEPLSPVRQAMMLSMMESHRRVVPITLSDDADIAAWDDQQNITIRLIRAVTAACLAVPMLNATFDDEKKAYRLNSSLHLGIAVDTMHGLYVPVIKNVASQTNEQLREKINVFKQQAQQKNIAQADLHGATIILSNFGALAGRYGTPIIIPPMLAIVGVGKARDAVVPADGKPAVHRIIPLSVTVDHRAVTGGEAARFLKTMMDELAKKQ